MIMWVSAFQLFIQADAKLSLCHIAQSNMLKNDSIVKISKVNYCDKSNKYSQEFEWRHCLFFLY